MSAKEIQCKKVRDQVVLFLLFITSDDCLKAFENTIPQERLAFELSRIWFDEIYVPGMTYLVDGLKGNFSEKNSNQFKNCFTEDEFKSLERFHRFFELRMEMLPDEIKKISSIPQNASWQHLKKHASYLAAELEPEVDEKRNQLEGLIKGKVLRGSRLLDVLTKSKP